MLNEKPDDAFDWKGRLDELESLPGESFERKNETWEKLHLRLNGKIRRKKIGWYWSAAACLFILALLVTTPRFHFLRSDNVVTIYKPIHQNNSLAKPLSIPLQTQNAITVHHTKRKYEQNISINNLKNITSNIDTFSNYNSNIHIDVSTVNKPQAMTNIIVSVDSASTNTTPLIAKKKFRVVHVNELGLPVEDDNKDARYADKPSIYKRFLTQEALYNSSASVNNTGKGILTLKINPKN